MKKMRIERIMTVIGWLLLVGFCVRLGCDYFLDYSKHTEYSAPFYVWILERSVEFILPTIICFAISIILKRKNIK